MLGNSALGRLTFSTTRHLVQSSTCSRDLLCNHCKGQTAHAEETDGFVRMLMQQGMRDCACGIIFLPVHAAAGSLDVYLCVSFSVVDLPTS